MKNFTPNTVFSPGEFLLDELEERGITQSDFAEIIGRPLKTVNEIIKGKKSITPETANAIAAVFGTSPEMWLGLQADYDLFKLNKKTSKDHQADVKQRAELYDAFPVRDLKKRKWISEKKNVEDLKNEIFSLFSIVNLSQWAETCLANFKKSSCGEINMNYLNTWIELGKLIAKKIKCSDFDRNGLIEFAKNLKSYSRDDNGVKKIVNELKLLGVRLIFLPHFSKTKVDGAAFWLNSKPIILMSLRYDRVDNFYFTLLHEIGHIILHGKNSNFIDDLSDTQKLENKQEEEANEFAQKNLAPLNLINEVKRYKPITPRVIIKLSQSLNIHPGILIGTLQHKGILSYGQYRVGLEKIKNKIPAELMGR